MNCSGFSWSESSNKAVILMTLYLGFLITFSHQWEYRYGKWSQIQLKDRLRLVSYDPVLRGVPKGSYANNPNGACLIPEFRQMVQTLYHIGLRILLDVVYNHLYANGPHDRTSVVDNKVDILLICIEIMDMLTAPLSLMIPQIPVC
ncbi:PREDICTED: uncharacterized protein LOC104806034 isoform X1 [Tarenaya hassleriana]|uniref:uncharacterized protein LOC104806034 isoform X1 n=1 Tax=Tarenaya hassleriana TaxID=28532 RepID=UPI0008FCEBC4|nr:PREDICTED: uncharacterized protein LOC104806034 isoform X1 [Tarenaya hassleriana]XP_019057153.1 PREDICTED: uncharacterized protein LOC104806034 isoform X1 [Tarenaya hassleriana]XP_019057154.1 PREDICTED: uncharacterized protein LOC104806034 isoform X1 [Tarenaya hassleriana]